MDRIREPEIVPDNVCRNCNFRVEFPPNQELFECRRHAPIVTGGMMSSVETVWPNVKPLDWCGDFENRVR